MNALKQAEHFVEALQKFPALSGVFNPWADYDDMHDTSPKNAEVRAQHLVWYLAERIGRARSVLIAEAPGLRASLF